MISEDYPPMGDGVDEATADTIRRFCGWHIAPEVTETVRLFSEGSNTIILPTLLLKNITSVKVNGREVTGYTWDPKGILYLGGWPAPRRSPIEVTMSHGYRTVPPALKQAATRMSLVGGNMPFSYMNVDGVSVGRVGKPANQSSTSGLDDISALILSPFVWGQLP